MLGNLTDALEAVETAQAIREANGDKEGVAWLLHSEAVILLQQAYERQVDAVLMMRHPHHAVLMMRHPRHAVLMMRHPRHAVLMMLHPHHAALMMRHPHHAVLMIVRCLQDYCGHSEKQQARGLMDVATRCIPMEVDNPPVL